MSNPGSIPNRWLNCPLRSDSIIADKFIAFKTPLDKKFDDQVGNNSFYPEMIFSLMKSYYNRKIGLWIDLTNTNRFYDKSEISRRDCRYIKLRCRGFGETPSPEHVRSFIEIVDEFSVSNPIDLIGIHCTHGFNRTGFLIVSYLIDKYDCEVAAAIKLFAQARPPGIYKQDYISELFKRYGEDEENIIQAPPLPNWCCEEEETPDEYNYSNENDYQQPSTSNDRKRKRLENNNQNNDNDDEKNKNDDDEIKNGSSEENAPKKIRRNEHLKLDATFMPGVPGVELMTDKKLVNELQHQIQDMCSFDKTGFPGSQPVSMDCDNIKLLHTKPYMVSWKADGTRYMMLIKQKNQVYFFDRDNACFKVDNLQFVDIDGNHLKDTLLDGEMVIDYDRAHNRRYPRYLVYDIVYLENKKVSSLTFIERIKLIRQSIIDPRNKAFQCGRIRRELEPFSVRSKDFLDLMFTEKFLSDKFIKQLSHEPDGLIFQPKMDPYMSGRCDDVLKWKPSSQNSVDFKLKIVIESGQGILTQKIGYLYVGGNNNPISKIKITKELKDLDNKIIECKLENNEWKFMRVRTDKSYPNSYSTAAAVWKSIINPVTQEALLSYIKKYGFREDHDHETMRPPISGNE